MRRREALAFLSSAAALAAGPSALAADAVQRRPIPGTKETLPAIGFGSSKVVSEIPKHGPAPVEQVLTALVSGGGAVVDTWPRDAANDRAFGEVIAAPALKDKLFITTKIDRTGKDAGLAQLEDSLRLYGRPVIDLAQIFSLTDLDTHWPTLKDFKAKGKARYIGVTISQYELYPALEAFLAREKPDFVQMNYSITERRAEERLLPLARDKGVAVMINRPFMNGAYFQRLAKTPLPGFAADMGCESWAQFSLKYILAHSGVTVVLTETSQARHMAENLRAATGKLPDAGQRAQMTAFIDKV
jgi:diketogulonate reductase-like aldo/keto reductase